MQHALLLDSITGPAAQSGGAHAIRPKPAFAPVAAGFDFAPSDHSGRFQSLKLDAGFNRLCESAFRASLRPPSLIHPA